MPLKRLDVSLARTLGWSASISLEEGIDSAYNDFLESFGPRPLGYKDLLIQIPCVVNSLFISRTS